MKLIGLDPGLRRTGWGVIEVTGNALVHVANGTVESEASAPLARRLEEIFTGLMAVLAAHRPKSAAVEETFVNRNPSSTLKLGMARGVVLLAPARAGLAVAEYSANQIKKSVVGSGHATKDQIAMMVTTLLPRAEISGHDAADAEPLEYFVRAHLSG